MVNLITSLILKCNTSKHFINKNHILHSVGEKGSGELKIRLPINPLFYCDPFNLPSDLFHSAWKFAKVKRGCYIDMNLKRAANLQQLK